VWYYFSLDSCKWLNRFIKKTSLITIDLILDETRCLSIRSFGRSRMGRVNIKITESKDDYLTMLNIKITFCDFGRNDIFQKWRSVRKWIYTLKSKPIARPLWIRCHCYYHEWVFALLIYDIDKKKNVFYSQRWSRSGGTIRKNKLICRTSLTGVRAQYGFCTPCDECLAKFMNAAAVRFPTLDLPACAFICHQWIR